MRTINSQIISKVAGKIIDSALHAAIFAYVSKKVGHFMDNRKEAADFRLKKDKGETEQK